MYVVEFLFGLALGFTASASTSTSGSSSRSGRDSGRGIVVAECGGDAQASPRL